MFASVFREASARALLLPRQRPGKRTPLWQQRQRSADLLVEAAKHPTFPMLLEATRECLRDIFDVPALQEVMADLRARRTKLVAVDTERASPFAQSLLFRWVAVFMYEGDAPLAERRAAALALDRDLLRELLGSDELRELLDPRAIDEVELELQRLAEGRRARGADGVHDLLRALGPLSHDEVAARTDGEATTSVQALLADGRAIAGTDRRRATHRSGRGRRPPARRAGRVVAARAARGVHRVDRTSAARAGRAIRPHPRSVRDRRCRCSSRGGPRSYRRCAHRSRGRRVVDPGWVHTRRGRTRVV